MLNHYTVAFSNGTARYGSNPAIVPRVTEPGELLTVEPIDAAARAAFTLAFNALRLQLKDLT